MSHILNNHKIDNNNHPSSSFIIKSETTQRKIVQHDKSLGTQALSENLIK
jgi:hypothetical protein